MKKRKAIYQKVVQVEFVQGKYTQQGNGCRRVVLDCGHVIVEKYSVPLSERKNCQECLRLRAHAVAHVQGTWVACSERLPEPGREVLVRGQFTADDCYPKAKVRPEGKTREVWGPWDSREFRGCAGVQEWFDSEFSID